MGRALARSAEVFLFDEPLSNLDAKLRIEVRTQIKLLHQKLGMTSIFVTHDQTEAMTLADRIVCLEAGRIAQTGSPDELYTRPANIFVASFIGAPQMNLFEAVAEGGRLILGDGQSLSLPPDVPRFLRPTKVTAGLRSEDLTDASRLGGAIRPEALSMNFVVAETLGSDTYLIGTIGGVQVTARCAPGTRPDPGSPIRLNADTAHLHLFDPETRLRL